MNIGSKIKAFLDENGIKQTFLAERICITPSQMSDICNGKTKSIDCVTYYKICKVLGVPYEYFIEDEGDANE